VDAVKTFLLLGVLCFGFAVGVGLLGQLPSDPSWGRTINYLGGFVAGCVTTSLLWKRERS
jgi:hypothetical protein